MSKEELLLRKLRGRLAYSKQCKPYMIFRDIELELLLKVKPKTKTELSKIKGFPSDGARVRNYGQAIIDIFNKADRIDDFKIDLNSEGEPTAQALQKLSVF